MPRARKRRIAATTIYGEPGDVEVGEGAEIIATEEPGIITHVDHKAADPHATIALNSGGSAQLPINCFRALRERARGFDTRVGVRK
jgi:hypothetical protein